MRHLAEVLRWSTATRVGWVAIVASAVGMAAPVLVGAAMGNLRAGLAASVGGLLVGGAGASRDLRAHLEQLVTALGPAVAAVTVAAFAAGHGWWTDAIVVLLGGVAAAIAGLGRPLAVMAMRFVLFLIIAITVAETASDRGGVAVLILAGALWASAVGLALGALARVMPGHRNAAGRSRPAEPDGETERCAIAAAPGASRGLAICTEAHLLPGCCGRAAVVVARTPPSLDRADGRAGDAMADRDGAGADDAARARRRLGRAGDRCAARLHAGRVGPGARDCCARRVAPRAAGAELSRLFHGHDAPHHSCCWMPASRSGSVSSSIA